MTTGRIDQQANNGSASNAGVADFEYLQAALGKVSVLIRRQVYRWQQAGQDPSDAFRGLYISDAEAGVLSSRPFGRNWSDLVQTNPEEEAAFVAAIASAEQQVRQLAESAHSRGEKPRLEVLAETFGLDAFDLDAFLICVAPCLDLHYERLFGYLQDDVTRKRPTVNLLLDLLAEPGPQRLFSLGHFLPDAPLMRHRLLEAAGAHGDSSHTSLLGLPLTADESIVSWVLGRYQPRPELAPLVRILLPQTAGAGQAIEVVGEEALETFKILAANVAAPSSTPPVLAFYGTDQTAQEAMAYFLAGRCRQPLLTIQLNVMAGAILTPRAESPGGEFAGHEGSSAPDLLRLALRDALLNQAIPVVVGWESVLTDGVPPPTILAELCAYPGLLIVCSRFAWRAAGIDRQRRLAWLEFPIPDYNGRLALWQHYLSQVAPADKLETSTLATLATNFLLTTAQIRDAVAAARDRAASEGRFPTDRELFAAARQVSNPRLSSLARKIIPRYSWKDIVLPKDQLTLLGEIINTVHERPKVLDEWGVGRKLASSRGITVLFAGQPGTGKTMAAEIIAGELNLDLYKIDLSTIVSKYIGETEKNLERIFNEAESSNAILFFDEADALFGKRSEVRDSHDRYANIEISYLLQRMEAYDGVTILATNLRANLDEAFTRRLQFAVDFPFPEEVDRLRIWNTLFPPEVPRHPKIDLAALARRFKLAGGSIRNILVSAAYLAASDGGQVTMEHLLHGARRELQKMGRLVGENEPDSDFHRMVE